MAERHFGTGIDDIGAARRFVAAEAVHWGLEPAAIETVVGELAANVFFHAKTPFSVSLRYADDDLLVEVADGSKAAPVFPVLGPPSTERGRGLLMVDALAASWGVEITKTGKVIWADLHAVRHR